jgi:biotin operon repressor/predicted phosphodiesterase
MVRKTKPELTEEEQKFLALFKSEEKLHIKEISDALDKSATGVVEMAHEMRLKEVPIWKSGEFFYLGKTTVDLPPEDVVIKENQIKIGFIADTILGSKFEQPTALCKAIQIAEHEGVDFMIHLGVSAGKPTAVKRDEFHKLTAEEQVDYIVKNYPKSNKFKIRLISGYHDMQWRKDGINILADVCEKREDLIYRGDLQSDFPLRRGVEKDGRWPILKAAHHGGDDSPYSKSYPVQGFAENLVQDINDLFLENKPDIVAVAGQGVFCDLSGGIIENLFSVPGLRLISPSIMKKKRRSVVPTIGFVIITVKFDQDGNFFVTKDCFPLPNVKNDYREKFSSNNKHKKTLEKLNSEAQKILKLLEESPKSRGELAQAIDKSDKTVLSAITSLRKVGFEIEGPDNKSSSSKSYKNYKLATYVRDNFVSNPINFDEYFFTTVEEAAVSDTHIGHHSELIPILNEAYDKFQERGIKTVNHTGDITNGSPKHQEHNKGEVREFRATPLINDVISMYPRRKGIITYAISGDHDRWFLDEVGLDILDSISRSRHDIKHLGIQQGERENDRILILLRHFNWGTGYAKSYKPQQVIEGGILKEIEQESGIYRGKVLCVLSGGGHVYCSMLYKGIIFILMPCLQGKTGFISGLGKISDVGFIIYSITYSKNGTLTRFRIEFFNRGAESLALVRNNKDFRKSDSNTNKSSKK